MGFTYDFAISYASETRDVALGLTAALKKANYRVFYDRHEEHALTGRDGDEALRSVYAREARLCILLLSDGYDASPWTAIERDAILGRERIDPTHFVIPVLVRGAAPPWLGARRLHFDLQARGMTELLEHLIKRAGQRGSARASPEILWRATVGIGSWKHEPIPQGDVVYVASAGSSWNEPDELDGIHCLRRETGAPEWHVHTDADANALTLMDGVLYVGTDAGTVYAVDAASGATRWRAESHGGAIVAKPLVVGDQLITFSAEGAIQVLDRRTGGGYEGGGFFVRDVRGGVVADPVVHGDVALVVSRAGIVFELPLERPIPTTDDAPQDFPQRSVTLTTWSQYQLDGRAPCEFHGTPVVLDELLLLPYVRDTLYPGVPVAAIERRRMQERFTIAEFHKADRDFGNVRARPVVSDGLVITPVAYGNEVVAFDRSGQVRWLTGCGAPFFPQWGSPALHGRDVLVPRFDGFLHAVGARDGVRRWSMCLDGSAATGSVLIGDELSPRGFEAGWESAGDHFVGDEPLPPEDLEPDWENRRGDSLNAPVSVAGDVAFVHTSGGTLLAVGLPPVASG